MGMSVALVTLNDANIRRVLDDPPLVWQVIAPDDPAAYHSARERQGRRAPVFRAFNRVPAVVDGVPALEMAGTEGIANDLEQAWHGIHYLLTGTAWEGDLPRGFLVSGGTPAGHVDAGYGPARVLTAQETRAVHEALLAVTDAELAARFDPADMRAKQIYPTRIWSDDGGDDDTLGYLLEHVRRLRAFLERAAEADVGIVIYVS